MNKIMQRSNYRIYFDDVRVDNYVVNWTANNGLNANEAGASVTMFRSDAMDKWKSYLTQVRIFGENPFTQKYTMLFDGEIVNRSWSQNKSNMGMVTFAVRGYYHWLDIPVPLGIQMNEELSPLNRFIYQAQNINIDEVRTLMMSQADVLMKDKSIEQLIENLYDQMMMAYYDVTGEDTAFSFVDLKGRFKVMVDVLKEFKESGFLDLFTYVSATQINSFYVYLTDVLSQLMFEFFQDRDGSFRIKVPSWSEQVLKSHIIDASVVGDIQGADMWSSEPTRVLAIGGESQLMQSISSNAGNIFDANTLYVPIGLYVGNPQDPSTEEYYSQQIEHYIQNFGVNPYENGAGGYSSDQWFDNTAQYPVTSNHRSLNSSRARHQGVDFGIPLGEPIYNIGGSGVVQKAGFHETMGNYVVVRQIIGGQTYDFRYMHFKESPMVTANQQVMPGTQLGLCGSTGRSTGPHLHLEIWRGGLGGTDIEPLAFLKNYKQNAVTTPKGATMESTGSAMPPASSSNPNRLKPYQAKSTGYAPPWNTYHITSYNALCPPVTINGVSYKGCTGITARGWDVRNESLDHRVIAVDPSQIPLNSIVEIEGLGLFNAMDTGGAIKGKRIDILATSYDRAMAFGKKDMRVRIVRSGKGDDTYILPRAASATALMTGAQQTAFSSPYANVDGPKSTPLGLQKKPSLADSYIPTSVKRTKVDAVEYKPGAFTYTIPSYAAKFKDVLSSNPEGVDGVLLASLIARTSSWRENYSSSSSPAGGRVGITSLPQNYVSAVLDGQNAMIGENAIKFAAQFLSGALEMFNGKVTFALAAYYHGQFKPVKDVALTEGTMDFSKVRGSFSADLLAFVDSVINTYTANKGGNYIKGDPHLNFGSTKAPVSKGPTIGDAPTDRAPATDTEVPDFEEVTRPKLSEEEKQYKMNLLRVEQALIRLDSSAIRDSSHADQLIYRFAKYTMQLHRARTHNLSVRLTTCLPFLRPGLNAWIEPTRTDLVMYVTNITHQGNFSQGCFTSISGGFVRDPSNYQDIDSSIFIGETFALSDIYGEQVTQTGMQEVRDALGAMHGQDLVEEAHNIQYLKEMYSSHGSENEYTTKWNKEMTSDELKNEIQSLYKGASEAVKKRKSEVAKVIAESEEIFLQKLNLTRV